MAELTFEIRRRPNGKAVAETNSLAAAESAIRYMVREGELPLPLFICPEDMTEPVSEAVRSKFGEGVAFRSSDLARRYR